MARIRAIKPDYFTDGELAEMSPLHRLLFPALWCHADRDGRLEDRPKELKVKCMPYDECDVDGMLWDLHRAGFVTRYEVGGRRYIAIRNFVQHQRFHKDEKPRGLPAPEEGTVLAPLQHRADTTSTPPQHPVSTVPAALVSDVLTSDVGRLVSDVRTSEPLPPPPVEFVPSVPEKPTKPDDAWDGMDFWAWAQAKRREAGLVAERRPNESAVSAWWSQAHMQGANPRALRKAFVAFGNEPYWTDKKRKPPCPFSGFLSQWQRYVEPEEIHAAG